MSCHMCQSADLCFLLMSVNQAPSREQHTSRNLWTYPSGAALFWSDILQPGVVYKEWTMRRILVSSDSEKMEHLSSHSHGFSTFLHQWLPGSSESLWVPPLVKTWSPSIQHNQKCTTISKLRKFEQEDISLRDCSPYRFSNICIN